MKVLELFEPAAIDVSDEDARMDAVIQALVNAGETVKRYDIIGMKRILPKTKWSKTCWTPKDPRSCPLP